MRLHAIHVPFGYCLAAVQNKGFVAEVAVQEFSNGGTPSVSLEGDAIPPLRSRNNWAPARIGSGGPSGLVFFIICPYPPFRIMPAFGQSSSLSRPALRRACGSSRVC